MKNDDKLLFLHNYSLSIYYFIHNLYLFVIMYYVLNHYHCLCFILCYIIAYFKPLIQIGTTVYETINLPNDKFTQ